MNLGIKGKAAFLHPVGWLEQGIDRRNVESYLFANFSVSLCIFQFNNW